MVKRTSPSTDDAHALTETVAQLRRVLRTGVRTEIAFESLPLAQVELLASLNDSSPARVNDLAERLRLAQSTVSGLVGQMMASGLVEREVDPSDRRAAVVTITPAGEKRLGEWQQAYVRRVRAGLAELDQDALRTIIDALPALRRLTDVLADFSAADHANGVTLDTLRGHA